MSKANRQTSEGLFHQRCMPIGARVNSPRWRAAFTLVEVLIVVLLLGMIAMIVLPKFLSATQDARESSLLSDLQTVRTQVEVYRNEHNGRGPHLNEQGELDTEQFVERLVGRTFPSGLVAKYGPCGPYLHQWPENPFSNGSVCQAITFGWAAVAPRDGTTGWYYNIDTCLVSPNSPQGALSVCPAPDSSPSGGEGLQSDTAGLKLTGIMDGPQGRVAMINGQRLREGQTINGARIVEIGPYQVKLELDGRQITIGMNKSVQTYQDAAVPEDVQQPRQSQEQPLPSAEEPNSSAGQPHPE